MKKRTLHSEQNVIILYHKSCGFTRQTATFIRYEETIVNDTPHQIPVFRNTKNKTFNGLECFWILPEDIRGRYTIERFQKEIIALQFKVLELSIPLNYNLPNKLGDKLMEKAAAHKNALVEKLGFDPQDESWLEHELAVTERERKWFKFEREKSVAFYQFMYTDDWKGILDLYNSEYKDNIEANQAKNISMKRMRFLMGSTPIRMSGNKDRNKWIQAAREFEQKHRGIEDRMTKWSESKMGNFPLIKTKKPVLFSYGSYFSQCIEKIPHLFTDTKCTHIKEGTILRVVSYDPETKNIRLDFTKEDRAKLKPDESANVKPWLPAGADYVFWVSKNDVNDVLEFVNL